MGRRHGGCLSANGGIIKVPLLNGYHNGFLICHISVCPDNLFSTEAKFGERIAGEVLDTRYCD